MNKDMTLTRIAVFKGNEVRKTIFNNEWWFSIVDVIAALTDSENSRDYWYKMKIREKDESDVQLSTFCRQLKLESALPTVSLRAPPLAGRSNLLNVKKIASSSLKSAPSRDDT